MVPPIKKQRRIPPHNIEAEQSTLGAMLLDKDAIIQVAEFLRASYFYDNRHELIFEAVMDLFHEGLPVDIVTLSDKLKSNKQLRKIGGRAYLTDLAGMVPTSAHAEEYAMIVREHAIRRNLISMAGNITTSSFDESKKLEEVLEGAEQQLFSVSQQGVRSKFIPIKELLEDAYERAERADKSKGPVTGISSGLKDLDNLLGGFQKSDLVIVASRPSVGKTALSLDFLRFAGVVEKKNILYFSLEMSNEQIIDRLIGMQAGVPFWNIHTGKLSDKDFEKFGDAMGLLSESDIYIDDMPGQGINQLRTKARRVALEHDVDIVFVDYLQLLHGLTRDNRVQEVSEISRGLKNMARELEVPVVCMSQLSRKIESRSTRRPQLSDLRESGSIEQDADVVMFISREETYNDETERKGLANIIVAKHRNGPTGNIEVAFVKEIASFRNLYKREKSE